MSNSGIEHKLRVFISSKCGGKFNSVQTINLDTVIGYKKNGAVHTFLESYSKKEHTLFE